MKKKKLTCIPVDFEASSLPQTRKNQFFDILKLRYGTLLIVGVLILIFCLPILTKNFFVGSYNDSITYSVTQGKTSSEDGEGARKLLIIYDSLANIILYPVIMIGLAGSYRVIRQLCYSEGIIFKSEFKKGIKENWKYFVLAGVILGLFQSITTIALVFLAATFISIFLLVAFFIFLIPVFICFLSYTTIYINKFKKSFNHSIFIYLKSSWKIIIFEIVLFGLFLLLEFGANLSLIKEIIYAALIVFALPVVILGGYELLLEQFDVCINVKYVKSQYRRGLYIEPKETIETPVIDDVNNNNN